MNEKITIIWKFLGNGKTKLIVLKFLMEKFNWSNGTSLNHLNVALSLGLIKKEDGLYIKGDIK